jgi:hypothetical protein
MVLSSFMPDESLGNFTVFIFHWKPGLTVYSAVALRLREVESLLVRALK